MIRNEKRKLRINEYILRGKGDFLPQRRGFLPDGALIDGEREIVYNIDDTMKK